MFLAVFDVAVLCKYINRSRACMCPSKGTRGSALVPYRTVPSVHFFVMPERQ
jgi:hypothetical protein